LNPQADRTVDSPFQQVLLKVTTVAILVLAFAIRLFHLGTMGLEFDEAFAIQAGYRSLPGIIHLLTTAEPHPPFYYSFLHFWYPLAGTTEFSLRFPSLFANILTIAFLIRIADWFDWRLAGRIAAFLLALNPWQIWYSQEARMYTPVALFSAAALFCALRAIDRGGRRDLVWYAAFMLLALFTHYYAMFMDVVVNATVLAYLCFGPPVRLRWRPWLLTQGIIVLVFLPWLAFAYRISLYYSRGLASSIDMPGVIRDALTYYSLGRSLPKDFEAQLSLGFLAVIIVGILASTRARPTLPRWFGTVFLSGYLLGPLAIGYVVSQFRSMYIAYYFFLSSPAFFLALGLGLTWLFRRILPVGIIAAGFLVATQLLSVQNYFFNPTYNKAELADAINYVEHHLRPGDGIVLDGLGQQTQFWYYHDVRWGDPAPSYLFPLLGQNIWQRTPAALDAIMAKQKGVWFLDYGVQEWDGKHFVESYLSQHYFRTQLVRIHFNRVLYFVATPDSTPEVTSLNLTCNNDVELVDVSTWGTTVPAGGVVPISLGWQALKNTPGDYVVSWRLLDPAGHVVLQRDSRPADGFSPSPTWQANQRVDDRFGLAVPTYLAPGDYQLVAQVYERPSGAVCVPVHAGKPIPGIQIPLAKITVSDAAPLPPLSTPTPQYAATKTVGPLHLLGYNLQPGPYRPGDVVNAQLLWQIQGRLSGMPSIVAQLRGPTGPAFGQVSVPLAPATTSASALEPGRYLVTYVDLPISTIASSSTAALDISINIGNQSQQLLALPPAVKIVSRPRSFTVPTLSHRLAANFNGQATLLGYDLSAASPSVSPGQQLKLTLYWQATARFSKSYKVFTHLVGPDGKIHGQYDALPLDGNAPTTSWAPGEVLTDLYTIPVDANAPPGTYDLVVGLYDPDSGARLPLAGNKSDTVTVTKIQVSAPR